jgi:hypothetical protein
VPLQRRARGLQEPATRPSVLSSYPQRGHGVTRTAQGQVDTYREGLRTPPRPRDRPWAGERRADDASVIPSDNRAAKHDLGALELRADDQADSRRQNVDAPSVGAASTGVDDVRPQRRPAPGG